jgi:cytochrome c553
MRTNADCIGDCTINRLWLPPALREVAHQVLPEREEREAYWMMKIARISEKSTTFCGRVVAVTMLCIVLNCVTALAAPKAQGAQTLFNSTCASCHSQNGTPTAVGKSLNAPDLGSTDVQKHTDIELQQIISNGKGNMPPFKGNLSEAQINSLAAYIRSFSGQRK